MDTNGIDLGTSFGWLGGQTSNTATAETTQAADNQTPLETENAEADSSQQPETKSVETETPKTEETSADSAQVPQIVDDLGGEDAARQLIPLVRAIQDVARETDETAIGIKLDDAVQKILTDDQYSQLAFRLYDKYGKVFVEQYLSDNPNWLKEQGFVKADAEAFDDDDLTVDDDDEYQPPIVKNLQAQLAQQRAELEALKAKTQTVEAEKAQASEVQIVEAAKTVMLGSVVDRVFEGMNWQLPDVERAAKLALVSFQNDPEAIKQFQLGVEYQRTQQAVLKSSQIKAQKKFEGYLAEAIEFVDAKRTKMAAATAPVAPARKEISTTTPGSNNSQQPNQQKSGNLFDPNVLMEAVQSRLRTAGAAGRR